MANKMMMMMMMMMMIFECSTCNRASFVEYDQFLTSVLTVKFFPILDPRPFH